MTETLDPNVPLVLPTQTQAVAAAQDAEPQAAPPRVLTVHGKSWPLVEKMSLIARANLQDALRETHLFGIVDGLASMVLPQHRNEVREYLLTDREPSDPEFVDDEVLLDVFGKVQEAFRG